MEKKLYKEVKKQGYKVIDYYRHWSRYYRKKDKSIMLTARKGDLLARDIFRLINDRVEPDAEGIIIAMIGIMQSYNYLKHGLPWCKGKDAKELIEEFDKLFFGDSWRWVKHDHMQIVYDFFFGGKKVDGDKLKRDIDYMLAREDSNRNN
jgi:hypothetical protein